MLRLYIDPRVCARSEIKYVSMHVLTPPYLCHISIFEIQEGIPYTARSKAVFMTKNTEYDGSPPGSG